MKVSDFIEFLKTQDQDAIVEVLEANDTRYGLNARWEPLNPEEHVDYTDLRNNPFVTDDQPYKNKTFLQLGFLR